VGAIPGIAMPSIVLLAAPELGWPAAKEEEGGAGAAPGGAAALKLAGMPNSVCLKAGGGAAAAAGLGGVGTGARATCITVCAPGLTGDDAGAGGTSARTGAPAGGCDVPQ
jgi:hypothetical protein